MSLTEEKYTIKQNCVTISPFDSLEESFYFL